MNIGTHVIAFLFGALINLLVKVGRAEVDREVDEITKGRRP